MRYFRRSIYVEEDDYQWGVYYTPCTLNDPPWDILRGLCACGGRAVVIWHTEPDTWMCPSCVSALSSDQMGALFDQAYIRRLREFLQRREEILARGSSSVG